MLFVVFFSPGFQILEFGHCYFLGLQLLFISSSILSIIFSVPLLSSCISYSILPFFLLFFFYTLHSFCCSLDCFCCFYECLPLFAFPTPSSNLVASGSDNPLFGHLRACNNPCLSHCQYNDACLALPSLQWFLIP